MDEGTSREVDGGEVSWSYRTIMETGSEELKAIISLITGDLPPGKTIKEEEEDARGKTQ